MASIWKRTKDRRDPNSAWNITYTDECGERKSVAGCTDRRATEEIARKLESDVAMRRRGVVDATAEHIAEQARVPISEHVAAFVEYVKLHEEPLIDGAGLVVRVAAFLAQFHGSGFGHAGTIAGMRRASIPQVGRSRLSPGSI